MMELKNGKNNMDIRKETGLKLRHQWSTRISLTKHALSMCWFKWSVNVALFLVTGGRTASSAHPDLAEGSSPVLVNWVHAPVSGLSVYISCSAPALHVRLSAA